MKIGIMLYCIKGLTCKNEDSSSLTEGLSYRIVGSNSTDRIMIINDRNEQHYWSGEKIEEYFAV